MVHKFRKLEETIYNKSFEEPEHEMTFCNPSEANQSCNFSDFNSQNATDVKNHDKGAHVNLEKDIIEIESESEIKTKQ